MLATAPRGISAPAALPVSGFPLHGNLAIPAGPDEEGPPDGLTLDTAIERLTRENLDLRAKFHEIPKAQADVLTLGEVDAIAYLNARRAYNDVVRQYRDTVVRHRRSMVRLNTVVGQRLLP